MENLRDRDHDHDQRKRKIAAISYNGTHDQTCGFSNAFQTYAASATSLLSSSSSSAGFVEDVCSVQDLRDGHHDPKKLKTTLPSLCKEKVVFSSPSASELSEVITIGSHTLSTPLPSSKYHHSSSLSSSPSPVLSSQDSAKSTGSSSAFNGKLCCPATSPLFSAGHEINLIEDAGFDEVMDLASTAHRLFERPTTKGVFDSLKNHLEPILMNRLKELAQSEATFEVGQEMADSVYLLKLLSSSNRELDIVGKKAGKGAMLLQEGVKLVREGQELLRSATSGMPNSNDKCNTELNPT